MPFVLLKAISQAVAKLIPQSPMAIFGWVEVSLLNSEESTQCPLCPSGQHSLGESHQEEPSLSGTGGDS